MSILNVLTQPDTDTDTQPTPSTQPSTHHKYDQLLHITCEQSLPRHQQIEETMKLFPMFTDNPIYDKVITTTILTMYAQGRGVGLDVEEAAHAADMTTILINKMLQGENISLELFITLIKTELFVLGHTKRTQLATMALAGAADDAKSAQATLENVFPKLYGKKMLIDAGDIEEDIVISYDIHDGDIEEEEKEKEKEKEKG